MNSNFKYCLLGVRNITSRRYLTPLLTGVLIGFLVANIFISIEPNSLWLGLSSTPQRAVLRDAHSSADLVDEEGPEKGKISVFGYTDFFSIVYIFC